VAGKARLSSGDAEDSLFRERVLAHAGNKNYIDDSIALRGTDRLHKITDTPSAENFLLMLHFVVNSSRLPSRMKTSLPAML